MANIPIRVAQLTVLRRQRGSTSGTCQRKCEISRASLSNLINPIAQLCRLVWSRKEQPVSPNQLPWAFRAQLALSLAAS